MTNCFDVAILEKMMLEIRNRRKSIGLLIMCWLAYTLAYCNRMNFSVAMLAMKKDMQLGAASLSFIGTSFYFSYAFGQLINGKIGDRIPAKVMICAGLATSSLCNILFGFSTGYVALLIIWTANGLALSALWGPIMRQLSAWFHARHRDTLAMIMNTSMTAGYMLSWGTSNLVLRMTGWRGLFWGPGTVSLVFVLLLLICFPFERKSKEVSASDKPVYWIRDIWKPTGLAFLIVACMAQGVIKDGISLFSPYILSISGTQTAHDVSPLVSLLPVFNLAGCLLAFSINRKMGRRVNYTLLLLYGTSFVCMLLMTLSGIGSGEWASVALLGIVSACMYSNNMLMLGSIPMQFAPYGLVSSVAGLLDFSSYMAASGAAALSGKLLDAEGINSILLFWSAITLPAILSILLRHIREKKSKQIDPRTL